VATEQLGCRAGIGHNLVEVPEMTQPLDPPKKEGDVTVFEIEVPIDQIEEPIEVPMKDKNTRLVVKVRPPAPLFSV
jgi:hypothetical protein